jgi:hypothetical protein
MIRVVAARLIKLSTSLTIEQRSYGAAREQDVHKTDAYARSLLPGLKSLFGQPNSLLHRTGNSAGNTWFSSDLLGSAGLFAAHFQMYSLYFLW